MALRVRVHVFSGRPDPTWILDSKQTADLVAMLRAARTATSTKPSGALGRLGYRGFSIDGTIPVDGGNHSEPFTLFAHEGLIDHGPFAPTYVEDQPTIENHLLSTGVNFLNPDVATHIQSSLVSPPPAFTATMLNAVAGTCPPCNAVDAPPYNPGAWNQPTVQPYNNCYNYANDHVTNTFAQPGRATGKPVSGMSCGGVQPSAQSDGLVLSAGFSAPLAANQGWHVALVIWPGQDFHWYRQDSNGCWSHKPGATPARNTDQNGNTIGDPQGASRGPYTTFCTYMVTRAGVTIR